MTDRQKILEILKAYHPSDAIALIEKIGKELRRNNAKRIYSGNPVTIEMERPDLTLLKDKP